MAEQVNIENVGGENGVASEITLMKLLAAMELLANKTGADNKMAIKKANEQYKKSISDLNKATKTSTKERKENTEAVKDSTEAHETYASTITGTVMNALGKFAGSLWNVGNELLQGGDQIGDFAKHLPYVGDKAKDLAKFADDSISSFRELSSNGASFNNSLIEMRYAAAAAELNLDEFSGLVISNTDTLRMMGGTVQAGVKQFVALNKELKDTGGFGELKTLGFTIEEINEGLLSYSNLQMRLGRRERMTQTELVNSSREYMKELNLISKVTGKQRKEIEQGLAADAANASFRAMANSFAEGSEESKNFVSNMAMIKGLPEDMQTIIKDIADGVAQTDLGKKFSALAPEAAEQIAYALQNGLPKEELINAFSGLKNIDREILGGVGRNASAMAQALEESIPGISAILNIEPELRKFSEMNIAAARKEAEATDNTTAQLSKFEDSVKSLRAQIHTSLLDTGIFQQVGLGLGHVNEGLGKAAEGIANTSAYLQSLSGEEKSDLIDKTLFTGGIVAAIAGLLAAPSIVGALKDRIGGMFGGGDDDGGRTSRRSGGRAGRSSALGGFAKRLGGMAALGAGGIKAGLGIAAIGAGVGAAIIAVGAAIAGAAWLTGAALPKFTDGIKTFEELDSAKLKDAATAIGALAGAMAKMAGGKILDGLASFNIDWFDDEEDKAKEAQEKLEKMQGIFKQLDHFSQFSISPEALESIKSNAAALKVYSDAMSSVGTGASIASAGSLLESISGFFGGENPLEKLETFSKADIKNEKLQKNIASLKLFTEAFESVKDSGMMSFDFNDDLVDVVEDLADVDGNALNKTAKGMKVLASINGFEGSLDGLKDLDVDNVVNYTDAIEDLVEQLEELNKQLNGETNGGRFGSRKQDYSAGDLLSQTDKNKSKDDVNTTALIRVLEEIREVNKRTLRAINNMGDV